MSYFDFYPVPKVFYSFETGEPFRSCTLCERDLFATDTRYIIEKAFRKKETIFEYAMCLDCVEREQQNLSINSRKLINHFFDEHVDIEQRRDQMARKYGRRTQSWLNRCMISGRTISQCEEHQIYGFFIDKDIVFSGMPYMLSGQVIDEILKLLSDETLGALDDLSGKLFGIGQPQGFVLL